MIDELFSIENKVIIITGSGKGIGYDLALNFVNRNAIIYCIDKAFPNKIPKNFQYSFFQKKCDITNKKQFEKICKEIFEKHKKIDVLINNAGITYPEKSKIYSEEKWIKTLQVNLTACFNCSQTALHFMIKKKNGVINIPTILASRYKRSLVLKYTNPKKNPKKTC